MQPEEVRNPPVPVTPPEPDETEKADSDLTSGFSPRTQGRLARTVAEAFSSAEAAHRRNEEECYVDRFLISRLTKLQSYK